MSDQDWTAERPIRLLIVDDHPDVGLLLGTLIIRLLSRVFLVDTILLQPTGIIRVPPTLRGNWWFPGRVVSHQLRNVYQGVRPTTFLHRGCGLHGVEGFRVVVYLSEFL